MYTWSHEIEFILVKEGSKCQICYHLKHIKLTIFNVMKVKILVAQLENG